MLLILCGNSAVGKDTYQDKLLERNKNLERAVSHTTRPMRANERDGKEYNFIDYSKFLKMLRKGEFVETRKYSVFENKKTSAWYYALSYEAISEDKNYITILDHQGINELFTKDIDIDVAVVYLMADSDVLRERAKLRGDDFLEFDRRLKDDKKQFKGIEKIADLMLRTDLGEHEYNLKQIEFLLN